MLRKWLDTLERAVVALETIAKSVAVRDKAVLDLAEKERQLQNAWDVQEKQRQAFLEKIAKLEEKKK